MGATTSLDNARLAVEPGGEAACAVRVRNSGPVVDQFAVEVLGDAAGWATAEPPTVKLLPGAEATAIIRFRPPRDLGIPAGEVPFGLRVRSREDAVGTVVLEGAVEVAAFTELTIELVPTTARALRRSRHRIAVDNLGNRREDVELTAEDPDQRLRFDLDRPALRIERGTVEFARLRVRVVDQFARGPDRTHRFQVTARCGEREPVVTPGTMVQRALLPRWLLPALAALLALAIVALTLWFTVLRTGVRSSATAGAESTPPAAAGAGAASTAPGKGGPPPGAAQAGASQAGGPGAGPAAPGPAGTTDGVTLKIVADASPQPKGTYLPFSLNPPPPAGKTLLITDLVLTDSVNDRGTVQVKRGNEVLLEVALTNLRDLDNHLFYHFPELLQVAPGQPLVLAVSCQNPASNCRPVATFSGRVQG